MSQQHTESRANVKTVSRDVGNPVLIQANELLDKFDQRITVKCLQLIHSALDDRVAEGIVDADTHR